MAKPEEFMVPLYHLELVRERDILYKNVGKTEAAAEVFHQMLDSSPVEKMAIIHCNSGMDMIGAEIVAIGGMEQVSADFATLYKGAIRNNAAVVIMAHNHVDGRVQASDPDFGYTVQAMDMGTMLGIELYDHLVVGPGGHYSIVRGHPVEFAAGVRRLEKKMMSKLFGVYDSKISALNPLSVWPL